MNRVWSLDDEKVVDKAPSGRNAWARTPASLGIRSSSRTSGMSCCRLRTNAFLLKDRCISSRPDFACFAANLQNPG